MKKLIIVLAAFGVAIGANAAAANWTATASNIYDGKGDSAARYAGTAYLFDAATYTQEALFASFAGGSDIIGGAIKSMTVANGAISAANGAFEHGERGGGSYSYFLPSSTVIICICRRLLKLPPMEQQPLRQLDLVRKHLLLGLHLSRCQPLGMLA